MIVESQMVKSDEEVLSRGRGAVGLDEGTELLV